MLCAVVVFVGTALGVTMYSWLHSSAAPPASSPSAPISVPTPQPTVTTVHFSASGDNLIHDGLYLQAKARTSDGSYDFMPLYENI
ncbi:MAG: CapA family protein, partial [Ruthenibacterium sp.]